MKLKMISLAGCVMLASAVNVSAKIEPPIIPVVAVQEYRTFSWESVYMGVQFSRSPLDQAASKVIVTAEENKASSEVLKKVLFDNHKVVSDANPSKTIYNDALSDTLYKSGIFVGFNKLFGNNLILGAELDATYNFVNSGLQSIRSSRSSTKSVKWSSDKDKDKIFEEHAKGEVSERDRYLSSIYFDSSLRARVGYSVGKILPYLTAGVNVIYAREERVLNGNYGKGFKEITSQEKNSEEKFLWGWTLGAGIEVAITKHLFLRGEYRFTATDFNNNNTNYKYRKEAVTDGEKKHPAIDVNVSYDVKGLLSHDMRIGLAYKF
ncbi:outer membrane protein [Bartonella sp. DGB1]|uniref:outer membrane protein n=1 Tax=Bartonella sp. DGB1 TaxID=3239807 RepID=UPI003524D91C